MALNEEDSRELYLIRLGSPETMETLGSVTGWVSQRCLVAAPKICKTNSEETLEKMNDDVSVPFLTRKFLFAFEPRGNLWLQSPRPDRGVAEEVALQATNT